MHLKNSLGGSSVFGSKSDKTKPTAEELYHLFIDDPQLVPSYQDLRNDVKNAITNTAFVTMKRVLAGVYVSWSQDNVMATVVLPKSGTFTNVIFNRGTMEPMFINHMMEPHTFFGDSYQLKEINKYNFSESEISIASKGNRSLIKIEGTVGSDFFGFYYDQGSKY